MKFHGPQKDWLYEEPINISNPILGLSVFKDFMIVLCPGFLPYGSVSNLTTSGNWKSVKCIFYSFIISPRKGKKGYNSENFLQSAVDNYEVIYMKHGYLLESSHIGSKKNYLSGNSNSVYIQKTLVIMMVFFR